MKLEPQTKEMILWAVIALCAWSVMVASGFLLDDPAKFIVGGGSLGAFIVAVVIFLGNAFPLTGDLT